MNSLPTLRFFTARLNSSSPPRSPLLRLSRRRVLTVPTVAALFLLTCVLTACRQPPPTDLRKLAPAETLVYLETNDLAKTLFALTESQAFRETAVTIPDFSALEKVQLAIAVTSFASSENQDSNGNTALSLTPRFVAVIETHAWHWQAVSLIENQIDGFVRKTYGTDAALEKSDQANGKFFAWSAKDGRRVSAFAVGSLIYFGNDAAVIEKRFSGAPAENSSAANSDLATRKSSENSANDLAFGYVSNAGIRQIADLAGISAAVETTGESNVRNFIARVLPQILQNTTREIAWTASRTERGIEDKINVALQPAAAVIKISASGAAPTTSATEFLPPAFHSATRYSLENPLNAWREVLVLTAQNTDQTSGSLLLRVSNSLLEPYGAIDAAGFLNSIEGEIITMQLDAEGERSAAIVTVKNVAELKKTITREINFQTAPTRQSNADVWFSKDKLFAAAFAGDKLILGESSSVAQCLQAGESGRNFTRTRDFAKFSNNRSIAVTFAQETDAVERIVEILAQRKEVNRQLATFYTTETRLTTDGIERVTVSDFGLLGTILKQL